MAIDQTLQTPTIRPPTSLDLLQDEDEPQSGSLTAPQSTQASSASSLAPAPTVNGLPGPDVSSFASQQMASPSRYDSSIVQQGLSLINQESDRSKERGLADMDEFYSSRGLVGSSVESQGRGDFLSQLNQAKEQRMFDLVRDMAATYSQDVGTAGQLGLGARAQELTAMGMSQDNAYRYAVLEQSGGQFQQELGQRESEFSRQYGLSGQQLTLERDKLMQQARLEGRSLDIQEATSQAEIGLRAQQLMQQAQAENRSLDLQQARDMAENDQFNQTLAMQRDQFAQQMGLDVRQLDQQREQYLGEFQSANADRMLRMQLQQSDQDFQRIESALNRTLENRALDLQKMGLDAESAWRYADRMLESQLENRALDLQAQGMTQDQAYRQATLQLDREQMNQAAQIANQQAQLSASDIYLRALAAGAGDNLPTTDDPNTPWNDTRLNFPNYPQVATTGTTPTLPSLPYNYGPTVLPPPTNGPLIPLPTQSGGGNTGGGTTLPTQPAGASSPLPPPLPSTWDPTTGTWV